MSLKLAQFNLAGKAMKESLEYTIPEEDRVPLYRKTLYGVGAATEPMFGGTIGNYLVLYYNAVLGLPAGPVGALLFIPRLWDAITDPFIGQFSDRTRSRWGRRRPYILVGGLLAAVFYALHWAPPSGLSSTALMVYLVVINCLFYTFFTVLLVPYQALGIELSPDYKERNSIMAIRKVANAVGDLAFGVMPVAGVWLATLFGRPETDERFGYGAIGLVFAVIAALCILVTFFGSKERPLVNQARRPVEFLAMFKTLGNPLFLHFIFATFLFVLALMALAQYHTYLFIYYLDSKKMLAAFGICASLLHIPLAFVWWWIANHIGKSKAIFLCMVTICVGCLSTYVSFNRELPYLVFIYCVLFSAGWCGFQVMSPSILADIVDIDELRVGHRREGVLSGMYGFCFKLAIAGAGAILGYGVDWAGFDPALGASQSEDTYLRLRLLTALLAGGFAALSAVAYWFFPLTPERALAARRELEKRRGKTVAVH